MIEQASTSVFEDALQQYEQEQKEKEENKGKKNYFGEIEQREWEGLEDKKDIVFRIIGNPIIARKNSYDPQRILFSKVLRDDRKGHCHIIWKQDENGEIDNNWILKRLYDAVMEATWVKYTEADINGTTIKKEGDKILNEKGYNGEYVKVHKDKPSFMRLDSNLKDNPSDLDKKYCPRLYPSKKILMNVISRMDDWCKENKHTKLLSSKVVYTKPRDDGTVNVFSEFGFPNMIYEKILRDVMNFRKTWNLDIIVQKDASERDYIVKDILEEKIDLITKELGSDKPLTEEELQYECYDIDKLSKCSSYFKLKKQLLALFKQASIDTGIDFDQELKKLVIEEEKERDAQVEDISNSNSEEKVDSTSVTSTKEEQEQEQEEEPKRRGEAVSDIETLCKEKFVSFHKVPLKQQNIILDSIISFSENIPVWKDPKDAVPCVNKECKFSGSDIRTAFPSSVFICPVCGTEDK